MIPAWNMAGVIPPIQPGQPGHSPNRSPYFSTLTTLIDRFSLSPERVSILNGLFAYRSALHGLGLIEGFQWLDGSFLENIEDQETRPPKDIDVVTYFHLPAGVTQLLLHQKAGSLFDNDYVKKTYQVDAFLAILGEPVNAASISRSTYWYSMWSHRRDGMWKGFVQIDLSPGEDTAALVILTSKKTAIVTT